MHPETGSHLTASATIHFRDLAEIACRKAAVCAADIVFRSGPLFAAVGEGDGPARIGLRDSNKTRLVDEAGDTQTDHKRCPR